MRGRILAGMLAALSLAATATEAAAKPRRIVSLNLCADELVLRLADRAAVASVTWLSRDPEASNVAALAAQVPVNHGLAEEVIPLDPDLVVAGIHTTRTAVALLKRAGFAPMELTVPRSFEEVRRQIAQVAEAVGEPSRGAALVAEMDRRLAAGDRTAVDTNRRALVLNPNGFTAGTDSLVDKIIAAAGLVNLAPGLGVGNYGQVPLETVVTSAPDILILNARRDGPPSLATELLKHHVFSRLPERTRVVVLPTRLWACGGPAIVDAVELLRQAASAPDPAGASQ